jgi:hypothetical protein
MTLYLESDFSGGDTDLSVSRATLVRRDDRLRGAVKKMLSEYETVTFFEWRSSGDSVKQIAHDKGKPLSSRRNFP